MIGCFAVGVLSFVILIVIGGRIAITSFLGIRGVIASADSEGDAWSWVGFAALIALWLSVICAAIQLSSRRRPAKAWTARLSAAWSIHGHLLLPVESIPLDVRDEVVGLLERLEKARRGLMAGGLPGDGTELVPAMEAVRVLVAAAALPKHGAQMAAAPDISDPAVQRLAAEYKRALRVRKEVLARVKEEASAVEALLAARRRARDDAQLIQIANRDNQ
ncbi:hypothetical protein [Arthrobacter sp. QXT-31]|uniref:hypothetical protein n=1 Tax=Arthrobacter sp. QXT-31 TaxID=1357915 RepID=UPI000971B3BE|nr:hypothetical protein [Arthrobacter sp. QXT-31]APX00382.1 hypothetical protein BWQ92_00305 [Arthrobacter sp. QXT-31]